MATFLLLSVGGTLYLGRNWDSSEEEKKHPEAPSGWGPRLFYNRIRARYLETTGYFTEPTFPKLLPDVDPAFERPLTLVLSLDDLLVHSEWTREHGWRMAKRPGVDYFLRYIQQYYELVIFTTMPVVTGEQVIRKLDPYRIVMWPLFREATKYVDGTHVKDLSFLNRDLSKVILMDTDPSHAMLQPENAIILPKWKGDPQDSELVAYIPFLEYVATMGIADARMAIKSFDGKHIPTEYATREAVARKAFEEEMAKERGNRSRRVSKGLLQTFMGPRLASGDGSEQSASEAFEQGKMLQDVMRERGQKQYETLEKELRENGEQWLKEMAAEDEKFRDEQMKDMKSSVFGFLGAAGKPRPKAPSETTK
ncbi:MAG: mitochondrial inner membrane protein required for protein import [Phylliscum demangeonii]|nr:MAG: mitochondrial inner membrane protein required for protein import [Phylliscum demangeonii]